MVGGSERRPRSPPSRRSPLCLRRLEPCRSPPERSSRLSPAGRTDPCSGLMFISSEDTTPRRGKQFQPVARPGGAHGVFLPSVATDSTAGFDRPVRVREPPYRPSGGRNVTTTFERARGVERRGGEPSGEVELYDACGRHHGGIFAIGLPHTPVYIGDRCGCRSSSVYL